LHHPSDSSSLLSSAETTKPIIEECNEEADVNTEAVAFEDVNELLDASSEDDPIAL